MCTCMWGDQVQGFKGNMFKSFNSRIEAQQYMDDSKASTSGPSLLQKPALSETVQRRPKSPTPLGVKRKHSYISTSMAAQPPSPQVPETYIPATQVCITYLGWNMYNYVMVYVNLRVFDWNQGVIDVFADNSWH